MKRYWLFAGSVYYPQGGISDLVDSFDTIEEARTAFDESGEEWAQIVDSQSASIVLQHNGFNYLPEYRGWQKPQDFKS
jgi:hypothetical protein